MYYILKFIYIIYIQLIAETDRLINTNKAVNIKERYILKLRECIATDKFESTYGDLNPNSHHLNSMFYQPPTLQDP